jgi:predicted phosphodiesterase
MRRVTAQPWAAFVSPLSEPAPKGDFLGHTMKFLIVSDIHGNREALEAVLKDACGQYDRIVCLGDIVCYGADPNFVVEWARCQVSAIVRGNHDAVCAGLESLSRFNDNAADAAAWSRRVLSPKNLAYLKRLSAGPLRHEGFDLAHGSPFGEYDYLCSQDDVAAISHWIKTPLTFFGHTHDQGGFQIKRNGKINLIDPHVPTGLTLAPRSRYLVNPGSVGQPRDRNPDAAYAIYSPTEHWIEFRRAKYDAKAAGKKILKAGLSERLASRLLVGA